MDNQYEENMSGPLSQKARMPLPFTPIIIVGAGRSGTNILRDTLTSLDGFETWPCDEINPIWRHGNLRWPNDEIPVCRLTPKISDFVRNQFIQLWKRRGRPTFIVEKTCANSLRVPFVEAIFPEARFIHLVRNGFDVAASAEKRWQGDFELPKVRYFLSKARYTPIYDLPIYGKRFLEARLKIKSGRAEHLGVWGPRFDGMASLNRVSLIDMCALQWINCVESADAAFSRMAENKVQEVKYELFMEQPFRVLSELLDYIAPDVAHEKNTLEKAMSDIRMASASKQDLVASRLSPTVHEDLCTLLFRKGYEGLYQ